MAMWNPWRGCRKCSDGCLHCYIHKGDVAKSHPNYHWLCAYKDGKKVGTAYALEYNGFVEMDDLWVEEDYRHQRIATTIMKYIADHSDGILYLHADASATPKDMYAKMGFEIVETVYEYYLEW